MARLSNTWESKDQDIYLKLKFRFDLLYTSLLGKTDSQSSVILFLITFFAPPPVGQEELIERVLLSSMLNPGEQWQLHKHHGRHFTLEYRLRFRCDTNYYGPLCNKFCRARDDFFGHFDCDMAGSKVCKDGWTGPECTQGELIFSALFFFKEHRPVSID